MTTHCPLYRRKASERGAAVLEFALSFLAVMFLLYGVMEFGRVIYCYDVLGGAVREGARYATVHGSASGSAASSSDVKTVVKRWAIGLDSSSLTVDTTWSPGNSPGSTVSVKGSYALTPFTGLLVKNALTLQSTSKMVISQ